MQQKNYSRTMLNAVAATAAMLVIVAGSTAAADEDTTLPPVQQAGAVSYRSGGVGVDESRAMRAQAAKYPLSMMFTAHIGKQDAYTAPSRVAIAKTDGTSMLDIAPGGPVLLVDLPAGKYKVSADYGQQSKTQAVDIVAGAHRQLVFAWKETDQQ